MKTISKISVALAAVVAIAACTPREDVKPEEKTINSEVVTRSCNVNGNEWTIMPEYPTADEIATVMAYIGSQVNPVSVAWPNGCTDYFIQHVGGAHHMYSYEDWNHAMHDNIDGTSSQEFFQVLENNGNWQHVYNFNAGKCDNSATHNAALMNNGFNGAKTLNEYASNTIQSWCLFLINGQYYLGIDFSAKKGDGEIPADGIYDDWVVKIIPLNGTPAPGPDPDPEPQPDPDPDPEDPDDPTIIPGAHVEFDIHQQEHKDWKEIKTSIHLRDTVDFHVLLNMPIAYQADPDDFEIRLGDKYEYLAQSIQIADKTYQIDFIITHKAEGIDIFVGGSQCAMALKAARALYGDGLTFEVHTYVKNEVDGVAVTDQQVWNLLKATACPDATPNTHLVGQITSAFYDERIDFDVN